MGYYSRFTDVNLSVSDFKDSFNELVWRKFKATDEFEEVDYFLKAIIEFDDAGLKVVKAGFESSYEEGKAYSLDEALVKYFNFLKQYTKEPIVGEMILEGEENGDISKYVLREDGTITRYEAVVCFDEEKGIILK